MRRRIIVAAAALGALLLAGCSSGSAEAGGTAGGSTAPASEAPASPSAPAAVADGAPPGWPPGLPFYAEGTLLVASVSEDGRNVNASWASNESADTAWATMDAALRAAGLVPVAETGAESMLIEDETQRSDLYTGAGLEAELIVVSGDQATVFLNASAL